MAVAVCSEEEFIAVWRRLGSVTLVAKELKISVRQVQNRRRRIEGRHNITLDATNDQRIYKILHTENQIQSVANITGPVIVFSDAHFMPDEPSVGFDALIKVIKKIKPTMIVANGDILDGGTISKYAPEGWPGKTKPTLKQELEAVQFHMDGIVKACKGLGVILHRTIGNHDIRFEKRLAGLVPEYKDIQGTRLSDHIPEWTVSWSVLVNDNTMIKHRLQHSGIHSNFQNVLKSGLSTCSGHTHLLEVKGWGDYTGRRWGVSTGMLANPDSQAFHYLENNPTPWCQGFAILTYDNNGRLLPPELCEVIDGCAYFRGSSL